MLPHRTQILTWLLILWQLLLPSSAPWLHSAVDESCCTAEAEQHFETACCQHRHSHDAQHYHANDCISQKDKDGQSPSDSTPHDCSNCAICQAISAPRVIVALVELPTIAEQTSVVETRKCADPLLGFCLPLQCRAPPGHRHCCVNAHPVACLPSVLSKFSERLAFPGCGSGVVFLTHSSSCLAFCGHLAARHTGSKCSSILQMANYRKNSRISPAICFDHDVEIRYPRDPVRARVFRFLFSMAQRACSCIALKI